MQTLLQSGQLCRVPMFALGTTNEKCLGWHASKLGSNQQLPRGTSYTHAQNPGLPGLLPQNPAALPHTCRMLATNLVRDVCSPPLRPPQRRSRIHSGRRAHSGLAVVEEVRPASEAAKAVAQVPTSTGRCLRAGEVVWWWWGLNIAGAADKRCEDEPWRSPAWHRLTAWNAC